MIPVSRAASTTGGTSSSCIPIPKLLVPRPTTETSSDPLRRVSMVSVLPFRTFGDGANRQVTLGRQFVGDSLVDLPTGVQEVVVLMVSELTTNPIVHAVTGFEVSVARTDSSLRVEVTDLGGGKPELRTPSAAEPRGRGLQIVKALSDRWGVIEMTGKRGKTVWFAVRLNPVQEDARALPHQEGSVRAL